MFARHIDGAFSRLLRALSGRASPSCRFLAEVRADRPERSSRLEDRSPRLEQEFISAGSASTVGLDSQEDPGSRDAVYRAATIPISSIRNPPMILDQEPDLRGQGTDLRGHLGCDLGRVRWLELRNKVMRYRLFNRFAASRHSVGAEAFGGLDPHSRLFAAEGYAHRHSLPHALAGGLPVHLSSIALHAGAGIRLAEEALAGIQAGGCEEHVLAAFYTACRRDSLSGFSGVTEEALGLVARTLYPHWMERLDQRVRAIDSSSWARFWHGAGRGIYFAPTNIPPFRALPWKGVDMCLREPPHQTGKRNALSGFSFALTLVNLRQPDVLASFFQHHGDQTACLDGGQAAMAAWVLSRNGAEPTELLATYCRPSQTARVPWPFSRSCHVEVEDEERRRPERLFSARPPKDGLAAR